MVEEVKIHFIVRCPRRDEKTSQKTSGYITRPLWACKMCQYHRGFEFVKEKLEGHVLCGFPRKKKRKAKIKYSEKW